MRFRPGVTFIAAVVLGFAFCASADDMADCPMMKGGARTPGDHAREVATRGDGAMGFSHEKTTHHFRISAEGGAIEVSANAPSDTDSRGRIRMHLTHIARAFAKGDFAIPMLVHDTIPPGVSTMKRRRDAIVYRYEEIPGGARVVLETRDPDALDAIHDFLRFQIADHGTGDPGAEAVR
ncbi:MAG: hypothetical protein ACRD16_10440 [Thermoanaerobaculia bacterium]